jgi:hypothetical protein
MLYLRPLLTATLLVSASSAQAVAVTTAPAEITQEQAIARAFEYTGLGLQPDVTTSAQATTVPADDDVPFLRLAGKPAWRVTLDNVRLLARGADGKAYVNPYIHRLDVWLDRSDGRLFKIISPDPPGVDLSLKATRAQREKGVESGPHRYVGLPAEMPGVNFVEALNCISQSIGGVTTCKQIEGLYVLLRQVDVEESPEFPCRDNPCPRWILGTRYLPPTPCFGCPPGTPLPPFSHFRTEIDPDTGKRLGTSESPGTVNGRPADIP